MTRYTGVGVRIDAQPSSSTNMNHSEVWRPLTMIELNCQSLPICHRQYLVQWGSNIVRQLAIEHGANPMALIRTVSASN